MRWTEAARSLRVRTCGPPRARNVLARTKKIYHPLSLAVGSLALAIGFALFLSAQAPEQKLISIYSPVANYSLVVVQRNALDYVGLLEMLEPLGTVSSRVDGQNWRLRFNGIEGVFPNGSSRVRIHGKDLTLPAAFFLENGRGVVPVDAASLLLSAFVGVPVTVHLPARRIFLGENGTTYTAQLTNGNPSKLVLNFSSPVNPRIATEPGKLRMTFTRDPVIGNGPPVLSFGTSTIAAETFTENNGGAEITISGGVPLLASFANDGRTITVAPAPLAASGPAPAAASSITPGTAPNAHPTPPAAAEPGQSPSANPAVPGQGSSSPVFVVIDPAHGGAETGTRFSDTLAEKDVTLTMARQLRQEFQAKGLTAILLRDGDVTLSPDQRAFSANAARPRIYISVHAASDGKGVRIYTALLSSAVQDSGPFIGWDHAQGAFLVSSQAAAASVGSELAKAVPSRNGTAAIRPLANIVAAAIAIEVAPRNGDISDLTAGDYAQQLATAIVSGISAVRDKLEARVSP